MSTYTSVPSADRDPESPVTPELIDALYFNPLAIQENDASAPDVQYSVVAGTITSQGALATLNTVPVGKIDTDAVVADDINFASTESSSSVTGLGFTVIPAGIYIWWETTAEIRVEANLNTGWKAVTTAGAGGNGGIVYSDGVNMRWHQTTGSTRTVYWRRIA